ncbi:amino acid ABC transporter permease [Dethiobacter alkaliphilus]|uniref:Polar amino acid ABC transporter, inner membrane subunit n=1 Tax=Dethiobacter alkaliphilus AHT 1 TaxID=555088 RepID=C0GIL6_DETAL|nr:amino acid ABC transporter permease [Dethiobacter alkaliphilus]EEG76877.1 polar amino acid ABC transporter, inner membrane subunit [Dethiobacter alkaliphilus AHT 1]
MRELDFSVVWDNLPFILQGAVLTVQISAVAVLVGFLIGSVVGLVKLSSIRPLRFLATAYIEIIRGTPLLVQIVLIYFGLASLNIVSLDRFTAGVIALSINSGAYVGEIVRSGIQSIDKGQMEAARSLGMNYVRSMRFIILPQAFRRIIPPLVNEFIMLIKDSSLLFAIGFAELMQRGNAIRARTYKDFEVFIGIAAVYFVMTFILSRVASYVERRTRIRD